MVVPLGVSECGHRRTCGRWRHKDVIGNVFTLTHKTIEHLNTKHVVDKLCIRLRVND